MPLRSEASGSARTSEAHRDPTSPGVASGRRPAEQGRRKGHISIPPRSGSYSRSLSRSGVRFSSSFPWSIRFPEKRPRGCPPNPSLRSNTARTLWGGPKIQRACGSDAEYSAYPPRFQIILPRRTRHSGSRRTNGGSSSKKCFRTKRCDRDGEQGCY